MIRYYCQYSYGGFKTFRIKGEQHEALTQEVTAEEKFEFPDLADLYFNHGGAKLLYRYFDDNTIALNVIRTIDRLTVLFNLSVMLLTALFWIDFASK